MHITWKTLFCLSLLLKCCGWTISAFSLWRSLLSEPGDPIYFSFTEGITIFYLGWESWAQEEQTGMGRGQPQHGIALGMSIKNKKVPGDSEICHKNYYLKGLSISATDEPGIVNNPIVQVSSGLWSTTIVWAPFSLTPPPFFSPSNTFLSAFYSFTLSILVFLAPLHPPLLTASWNWGIFFICTCWVFPVLLWESRWTESFMVF